jgi:putative exosortase-associated protein (TIGR04073 family)
MKKIVAIFIIIVLFSAVTAVADDITSGPVKKLGRGVANVLTSPFALIQGMGDAKEEGGIFAGCTWGVFMGVVNVVKRIAVGAFEIATFPVPIPENYGPILTDPEFFMEKGPNEIKY